jgi:hypothetical protein
MAYSPHIVNRTYFRDFVNALVNGQNGPQMSNIMSIYSIRNMDHFGKFVDIYI